MTTIKTAFTIILVLLLGILYWTMLDNMKAYETLASVVIQHQQLIEDNQDRFETIEQGLF